MILRAFPGVDPGFYKGRCPIHLKGAPEAERQRRRGGGAWGGAQAPPQKIFVFLISKNGEFYAFSVMFIDTVTANCYERKPSHLSCKKSTIVLFNFCRFYVWNEKFGLARKYQNCYNLQHKHVRRNCCRTVTSRAMSNPLLPVQYNTIFVY